MQKGKRIANYQDSSKLPTTVLRGGENSHISLNLDANKMAEIQSLKLKEEQLMKQSKIESFLNSTKQNASKYYKEKIQKNQEKANSKKILLEKQRELKQKYTLSKKQTKKKVENREEEDEKIKEITKKPPVMKPARQNVNWKIAEKSAIHIPDHHGYISGSESQLSAYDSEIEVDQNENPIQILSNRERIKSAMLMKAKY